MYNMPVYRVLEANIRNAVGIFKPGWFAKMRNESGIFNLMVPKYCYPENNINPFKSGLVA